MSVLQLESDWLGSPVQIYYEDEGSGLPVVLIHGWPLDHTMWNKQRDFLVQNGYRVVTYDRRGFGKSSKPNEGYNYNRFAEDLHALVKALDLQNVTLVGFSMGAGEVVRYMLNYFGERVSQVGLISGVTPGLLQSESNPHGVPAAVFDTMIDRLQADPMGYLDEFADQCFAGQTTHAGFDAVGMKAWMRSLGMQASPRALRECVKAFSETDFTGEMASIVDVPSLVVHGKSDRIAPFEATGLRSSEMLHRCVFKAYDDAPHGLFATHADRLNEDMLHLIRNPPSITLPTAT